MKIVLSLLLLTVPILAQTGCPRRCHDVQPELEFPCDFYVALGQCNDDIMKNEVGEFAYCFCSCGRCVAGATVPPRPEPIDTFATVAAGGGNSAVAAGSAVSTSEVEEAVADAVAEAVATIDQELIDNVDADLQSQAIAAAQASADVVATAIATAFAATEIRAATQGDTSSASGTAFARAESIAIATASAYATAFASAADDFVLLEAETLETDVSTALVESFSEVVISGDAQASAANEAIATTVAEAIASATASAFARYAEGEAQSIGRAIATADVSNCPSTCNDDPPPDETGATPYSCEQQKNWGKCEESYMSGYCECTCETCSTSSAQTISDATAQVQNGGQALSQAAGDAYAEDSFAAEVSTCPCNDDAPPDDSGLVVYTCEQQRDWGKCGESYMAGYCECTCGTCEA